jgi:anti-sigma factor RsiW
MKCEDSKNYLPAYLDDELDVADILHVQSHLAACVDCRQVQEQHLALRSALRGAGLYAEPAAEFRKRLDSALRRAAKEEAGSTRSAWLGSPGWIPAFAALVLVVTIGVLFVINNVRSSREQVIASAVLVGHIRSLQGDHLIDVPSSDTHTVKPWFQGKLDFSPPVPDLQELGWPLIGGRLDYLGGRPVAALVYQRRKHNINVFLWPNQGAIDDGIRQEDAQGYQILHWNGAAMTYWVVSDLNSAELRELARALRGH